MNTVSGSRVRVALLGFSDFERAALAARLRSRDEHLGGRYGQVLSLADARFIVADADHPGVIDMVLAAGRQADTLFVGAQAPEGSMAWMMRPLDPLHVLRELDAHTALHEHAASDSSLTPPVVPPLLPQVGGPAPAPAPSRRASDLPRRLGHHR